MPPKRNAPRHALRLDLDEAPRQRQSPPRPGGHLSPAAALLAEYETVEKDHGRIETRRHYQSDQLEWFAGRGIGEIALNPVGEIKLKRVLGDIDSEID